MQGQPVQVPVVSVWELGAWYRRLKAAILVLEDALEAGELAEALADRELPEVVGTAVTGCYGRLLQAARPARSAFRRASIHAVLGPLKELLEEPRHWHRAETVPPGAATAPTAPIAPTDDESDPGLPPPPATAWGGRTGLVVVQRHDGPVHLRLHHLLAARFWGIGFEFDDPTDAAWFANGLVLHVLHRLAADLRDLDDIERFLRPRSRGEPTTIVADPAGRRFEQLMLDLLNQDGRVAGRARLSEDFLEKTDLRVRLPGLQRTRGARVQVTQTTRGDFHEQKLARIRRLEEYVILSPRTLAAAVAQGRADLDAAELKRFWSCFRDQPATVDELGERIKTWFIDAVAKAPADDPRGPAVLVPEPLRLLVSRYVAAEAHRSTEALRQRQAAGRREKAGR